MMRRVLMVAYYFPPLGGMGSVRAARFARHLPAEGWEPVVLAPKQGMYHRPTGQWAEPDGTRVERTGTVELSRIARDAYRSLVPSRADTSEGPSLRPVEAGGFGNAIRRLLRDFIYLPDAQIGWYPSAVRRGRVAMALWSPKVIFTSSVPYTAHLVGLRLRRQFGVPWVAEFRDLWTRSQDYQTRSPARRVVDARLEETIVRSADAIVVTTDSAREILLADYPGLEEGRVGVVTNAFETEAHPSPAPAPSHGPLVLVHAGTLIPGLQDPAPLVSAVKGLNTRVPGCIRLRILGPPEPWKEALTRTGLAPGVVEFGGILPPQAVPEELSRASAVLILAPGEAFGRVILGKTFEWMGSGQPALMIVDRRGEMARLAQRTGGAVLVARNREAEIRAGLESLLDHHRGKMLDRLRPNPHEVGRFEAREVTRRLAEIFSLVSGGGQ